MLSLSFGVRYNSRRETESTKIERKINIEKSSSHTKDIINRFKIIPIHAGCSKKITQLKKHKIPRYDTAKVTPEHAITSKEKPIDNIITLAHIQNFFTNSVRQDPSLLSIEWDASQSYKLTEKTNHILEGSPNLLKLWMLPKYIIKWDVKRRECARKAEREGHYSQPQPPDYATSVAKWFNPLKTNTPGKTDGRYMCLYELQSSAQSGTSNAPQKASSQQAETGKQYTNDNLVRGVTLALACDKLPGWATLAPRKPSVNRLITPSKHRSREVPTPYKNKPYLSSTKVAECQPTSPGPEHQHGDLTKSKTILGHITPPFEKAALFVITYNPLGFYPGGTAHCLVNGHASSLPKTQMCRPTHDSLGRNPPPVLTHRRVTYDGVSETVAQFDTQVTRVVNE
ncbi:hypothetical protein TOT_030000105 [Theileria orientalis strain Shintoku]|uniref:Uncharacterized protein n=1 Tax=Theileria orientalis strain Shintoku TaxID=869250 RepID=J4C8I4_THEOR|nr:LOW QUALITY PROTEIN: hypothetical protein TOT_030000105 [Theileria orientalis strain Shintoku]BAM40843.1 hypothetical protein TOT_030000105 [Theileria orientalis strain Shintoku]|eukprot:XP_009691144.1 LOW QUALITY PROTEIN: hypothetical protein TOT_030000105 [Theileria orientalis strain Shintoku]